MVRKMMFRHVVVKALSTLNLDVLFNGTLEINLLQPGDVFLYPLKLSENI